MRTPIKTLDNGLVIYQVRLAGGPCDGIDSMASSDRVLMSTDTGCHLYLRGEDDLYHHQPNGDRLSPRQLWLQYRERVYLDGVTAEQEAHCSRAFYAGIEALFKFMETVDDLPESECEEAVLLFRKTTSGFAAATIPKPES